MSEKSPISPFLMLGSVRHIIAKDAKEVEEIEKKRLFSKYCVDGNLAELHQLIVERQWHKVKEVPTFMGAAKHLPLNIHNVANMFCGGMMDAAQHNHIDIVHYLLTSSELQSHADVGVNNHSALVRACEKGHLEMVHYLLTIAGADIHADNDAALCQACRYNHLQIVQYLLTSPELANGNIIGHADIHAEDESPLSIACRYGHLQIVQYLLTSPELKSANKCAHINGCEKFSPLYLACEEGHLDIVKYLLSSPELSEHSNIHDNEALAAACRHGYLDIVQYMLGAPELLQADKNGYIVGHADVKANNGAAFKGCFTDSHHEIIKYLMNTPGLIEPDAYDNFAIKEACLTQNADLIEFLIVDKKLKLTKSVQNFLHGNNEYHKSFPEVLSFWQQSMLHDKLSKTLAQSAPTKKMKL